ncbi:class I SAM-dependent methyltransferase [Methylocystis parvus]|uniref:Class I SAM-dependent methyltransferase n=1 Tax=Methylocystis parvus TaxID=134 RepID=A0A6B8M630_9HYPH|nr:class I SAM-dependent methyltransferase [Methylocystis parvus]QGM97918.1 class I SAM-dependent methyltransferase [Methylocystis parvus]WBK01770.1 class I SAM-dependent methyltransferase [Methylocystis parvus OBBP]
MRTREAIEHHYRIERSLANRLRHADKSERRTLYTTVYDELFRTVPDHPQIVAKGDADTQAADAKRQFAILSPFLNENTTYLEIGPGDCSLAVMVASKVAKVYAVDVSEEITALASVPSNFQLVVSDGATVPVASESVDVVYSNQLMEHLHVDDALEQLGQVYAALKPGGVYICVTPNRLCGPHDVSAHFDIEPTGLHLKEYDNRELISLFRAAGFRDFKMRASYKRFVMPLLLPISPFTAYEGFISIFPCAIRKSLAAPLIALKLVAFK